MKFNRTQVVNTLLKLSLYLITVIGVISLVTVTTSASLPTEKKNLPLPSSFKQPISGKINQKYSNWQLHKVTINKNGSLSKALSSIGIPASTVFKIQQVKNSSKLTNLRVGDKLNIWVDQKNKLQEIFYPKTKTKHFQLSIQQNKFKIKTINKTIKKVVVSVSGQINGSFYLSAKSAGLSARIIMSLSDIFGWEIDFVRQLRKGDPFKVIYEQHYIDDEYIGDGDILAAEITTAHNDRHTAFLLKDKKGEHLGYYDSNKRNLRKAFLRSPVDYVRITSRFKPKRYHPVLKKWRSHRGVDYAATRGTPIRATGDGQIVKLGWSRSYGRVIYIKHAGKYKTVYAHMSRYGKYKKWQWVKQGQIIGYIGASGLATGPHLHYEFRKRGHHVDPLKVKFPDAGPVPKKYRTKFVKYASLMQAQLDRASPSIQLARKFE